MRLFVICPTTRQRIYLALVVERRSQIDESFTVRCPYDGQTHLYRREDVNAEPTLGASIGGAILGGILGGLIAGPLGAILAGGTGLFLGSNAEEEERRRIRRFYEG
jgi:hypothetical protein